MPFYVGSIIFCKITGHPAFMDKLPTFWAVKSNIQVSGELTTSRGPGTAFEFALSLVEQLFGSSVSEEIERNLVFFQWSFMFSVTLSLAILLIYDELKTHYHDL